MNTIILEESMHDQASLRITSPSSYSFHFVGSKYSPQYFVPKQQKSTFSKREGRGEEGDQAVTLDSLTHSLMELSPS
jgi:hypothetical protein